LAFRKKDPSTHLERDLDSSLAAGKPVEKQNFDGSMTVWSASGSFGVVFKYETFAPHQVWALKCFCRSNFEVVDRYQKILSKLSQHPCADYFVNFTLLEEGIRVLGQCYPLLKMEWVDGVHLKKFLKANLDNPSLLKHLAEQFLQLSNDLRLADIAHGDLQHGNILITSAGNPVKSNDGFNQLTLKLIDYDSLYFGGDRAEDNIKGIADYQHPLRQSLKHRCREVDFFSQLIIYTSILALSEQSHLWEKYRLDQREGLLFTQADFQNPHSAAIFKSLTQLPAPLPELARKIKAICQLKDFAKIPSLASVLGVEQLILKPSLKPTLKPIFQPILLPNLKPNWALSPLKNSFQNSFRYPLRLWQQGQAWLSHNLSELPMPQLSVAASGVSAFSIPNSEIPNAPEPDPISAVPLDLNSLDLGAYASTSHAASWNPRAAKNCPLPGAVLDAPAALTPTHPVPTSSTAITIVRPTSYTHSPMDYLQALFDGFKTQFQQVETSIQTGIQAGVGQATSFQRQVQQSLTGTIGKLKPNLKADSWTTAEVAAFLGCSPDWCYQQCLSFPRDLRRGAHYFQDHRGVICWTKRGAKQLYRLHQAQQVEVQPIALPPASSELPASPLPAPPILLSTKAVSQQLQVRPEQLIQIRAKYAPQFQEGHHYQVDSRKHYHWTPEGIAQLEKYLAEPSPRSRAVARPKAKPLKAKTAQTRGSMGSHAKQTNNQRTNTRAANRNPSRRPQQP
jgi:serine/threonine protein kinase